MKIYRTKFAVGCLMLLSACRPDFEQFSIEGELIMGPAKGWRQLEIRSDKIDANSQKYTKFINPGKKVIQISGGSRNASITIHTAGRVPIAKFEFPLSHFDPATETFSASSYELNQTYNIDGRRVRKVVRREYVPHAHPATTCVVKRCYHEIDPVTHKPVDKPCAGVRGNLWFVEDYRNDYVINFTILDPKDPANLVARFTGKSEVMQKSEDVGRQDCKPRIRAYDEQGRIDLKKTAQLLQEAHS